MSTAGTTFDQPPLDAKAVALTKLGSCWAQVMAYVAVTVGFAALGAYLGRDLSGATGLVLFIAFACIIGLNIAAAKGREQLAIGLLFGLGLLLGLAVAPLIADYASADPSALWQAAGATAGFVAACGAYGYATRRDLSSWARTLFWALLGLIGFGHGLRLDPQRQHHPCHRRARDLRRVHDLRLQPAAPSQRRQRGGDRGEHLPRHLQRLSAAAPAVRGRARLTNLKENPHGCNGRKVSREHNNPPVHDRDSRGGPR
jgi:hypothetical protein